MTVAVKPASLGLAACTAIVVGNMVGSGFYLSPSAVAPYGLLAIVMWIVMGAGAICLGLAFARLARIAPATGGPYAYTRLAYGDFAGFLIAWGYWISIWASLPVMALAFTGAIVNLVPQLKSQAFAVMLTVGAIWFVVLVNLRGVKAAGLFAEVTTYAKLVPFAAVALIGLFFIQPAQLTEFNPSGQPLLASMAALAPLTMFAYLGLESATVPAGDVRDPDRTIPRSTILGIGVAALLYVLGTRGGDGCRTARSADRFDRTVPGRGDPHVGVVGGLCGVGRRHRVVDRRVERLDAVDGAGPDGGRAGRVVPALCSVVCRRAACRRSAS